MSPRYTPPPLTPSAPSPWSPKHHFTHTPLPRLVQASPHARVVSTQTMARSAPSGSAPESSLYQFGCGYNHPGIQLSTQMQPAAATATADPINPGTLSKSVSQNTHKQGSKHPTTETRSVGPSQPASSVVISPGVSAKIYLRPNPRAAIRAPSSFPASRVPLFPLAGLESPCCAWICAALFFFMYMGSTLTSDKDAKAHRQKLDRGTGECPDSSRGGSKYERSWLGC